MKQGFQIELAPTPEQVARLASHTGLTRVVYNRCLDEVKRTLDARKAAREAGVPDNELPDLLGWSAPALERYWRSVAHEYEWFASENMSSRVPKEACRNLASALKNFSDSRKGTRRGRRMGFPKHKVRKHGEHFRIDEARLKPVSEWAVSVPNVGKIATRENMGWLTERIADSRARVLGSKVTRQAGRWFVSFQLEVDRTDINERHTVPAGGPSVGIDVGIKTFATIASSDGQVEDICLPAAVKKTRRRVRRLNKELARRVKGSSNWGKTRDRLAAAHVDAVNARKDFHHKLTTSLTRTKTAIVIEDLNVAGMVKNRRLARAISEQGWAEFARLLTYKAGWYGSEIVVADRWFASSRLCRACGAINASLTLNDRVWVCVCGVRHDRDVNAARNLLAQVAGIDMGLVA